ncbi:MAG: hypothetical protein LBB30_00750 [Candidatus Methanoplasma sp.]|jgi:hypothetical protein|nr:hypothetical protein [Candidatus Methanoplasma sp.]
MIFGRQKDIPEEISKVKLGEWYSGMSDQDKVRTGRYIRGSDTSSALNFTLSLMRKANQEENSSAAVLAGENILKARLKEIERFDVLEEIIPAYYGVKRYDDCLRCCEEGIATLCGRMGEIKGRNGGSLPERIMCRNYTINVLVGIYGDYDAGDEALDRFCGMGLISEEDVEYRKQSHKIHRLQRTFDGIFSVKLKDR